MVLLDTVNVIFFGHDSSFFLLLECHFLWFLVYYFVLNMKQSNTVGRPHLFHNGRKNRYRLLWLERFFGLCVHTTHALNTEKRESPFLSIITNTSPVNFTHTNELKQTHTMITK